jgi:hypothetical protein
MRRATLVSLGAVLFAAVVGTAAMGVRGTSSPVVTREVIAVYLGTMGTDTGSGMIDAVFEMKVALAKQAGRSGREFVSRGVSLEPSVQGGMRHLALLGFFDEVSVGGNWTNSAVVRYLGPTLGQSRRSGIPQVVVLEREVLRNDTTYQISPEREIARYVGTDEIGAWVRQGAPLPR